MITCFKKWTTGFTLVEILVVLGIVGLLSTVVATSFSAPRRQARDVRRLEDTRQLRTALELYFNNNRRYPALLEGLAPDFISVIPRDPSGVSYSYSALGTDSVCGSYHLGANFETDHAALTQDVDSAASAVCSGSTPDFSGKDVVSCGGVAGTDRCYDIVPEILAAMEQQQQAQELGQEITAGSILLTQVAGAAGAAGEHFTFSSGGGVTPRFVSADIQPRDVKVGDTQFLRAEVEDSNGTFSVIARTELDNSVKSLALQPEGGAQIGCTSCKWSISWVVNDTSHRAYHTVFTARSTTGQENTVTIAWTDPCSPGLSGAWTLDDNCTISGVNGVDGGNLTVSTGRTMTLSSSATWAINLGQSIQYGAGGGSIAFGSGSSIKYTNLWIKDADSDTYAPNSTDQLAQDSQPSTYRRRNTAVGTSDPNDADATVYQTKVCYLDSDGDTYTTGGAANVGCGASCGTGTGCTTYLAAASGTADCYDSNANAKPGQTSYFTTNRGDGSYDYDCDGIATQQYTGTNACP